MPLLGDVRGAPPALLQDGVVVVRGQPVLRRQNVAALLLAAEHAGADAVLAASVFHFGDLTIGEVKAAMAAEGITVR